MRSVKKIFLELHLWLGLISGLIVMIVCLTGSIYAFKDEITDLIEPWRFVKAQNQPVLKPSQIISIADSGTGKSAPTAITYGEATDAVVADYSDMRKHSGVSVFINPYSGAILKITDSSDTFDFFRFVLRGHRWLWLPRNIGRLIVGSAVLLFLITLISGIVIWWPKRWNRKILKNKFKFSTTARSPARLNWDLHNVLGIYASPVLIILCITGLVWSFQWWSNGLYFITSLGKLPQPYTLPKSDTIGVLSARTLPLDSLYFQLKKKEPQAKTLYLSLPQQADGVIRASIVHRRGSYYRTDNLYFDRYTLAPLEGSGPYAGAYRQATGYDRLRRMNLEIHDGRIFGIWGKILVSLSALIGCSLPVTGFILWYRKRRSRTQS